MAIWNARARLNDGFIQVHHRRQTVRLGADMRWHHSHTQKGGEAQNGTYVERRHCAF